MESLEDLLADFLDKRDTATLLAAEAEAKLAESQAASAASAEANGQRETSREALLSAVRAA